jgi:glycosyltransferase involved in cell wall biosynthesis
MLRALVHAPYYRPHVGGLETYVEELHDALWATGQVEAITVVTPSLPEGAPEREDEPNGTRIVRYPAFEVIPNFPVPRFVSRGWRRAWREGSAMGPDVVVGHTRFFVPALAALVHARRLGAPYVHVEHGSDFVQMGRWWAGAAARVYDHTFGRLVLRRADVVIAISAAAADFVQRLAGVEATVVYRGLPLARLAAAKPPVEAAELAGGRPLIAYVGRLIDGKGVADLVDAVAALSDDALCVIVGDGPCRADLEARSRRHGERFLFTGYLPEDEALSWVAAADVVVNPSYTEGLPTTVLWAAALGRGIVASDVGGTSEVVTHESSALLVAPRDVEALRHALARVLADPQLRARLGAAARADVRSRFDEAAGAARWLEAVTPRSAALAHSRT